MKCRIIATSKQKVTINLAAKTEVFFKDVIAFGALDVISFTLARPNAE